MHQIFNCPDTYMLSRLVNQPVQTELQDTTFPLWLLWCLIFLKVIAPRILATILDSQLEDKIFCTEW